MNNNDIEEDVKILEDVIFEKKTLSLDKESFKEAQAIENILADRERLEKESKKNKDALEILNKMKKKYKIDC